MLESRNVSILCSRTMGSVDILRCYDRTDRMAGGDNVVIGGIQSKIEKDVLCFPLKDRQLMIMVFAGQLYKKRPYELTSNMNEGESFIINTAPCAFRVSKNTADKSTLYISEKADE